MKNPLVRYEQVWRLLIVSLLIVTAILNPIPVAAQSSGEITVAPPDLTAYPELTTTFRAIDPEGNFIKEIRPAELRVEENNAVITDYSLEMINTGVRFIVAVNEGPTLANRYSGVSRFDRIKTALFNWIAKNAEETSNEFSLIANQGPLPLIATDPASWKSALEAYQPDLRAATPGMASLSTAIDAALVENPENQKTSVILFVTPMPTDTQFTGMEDLLTRARENGVRVMIWLIGPQDYNGTEGALRLQQYAESTGGRYALFSGSEELPDLSVWLDPFSYLYQLSYQTKANVSGDYSLVLHLKRGEVSLDSTPVSFTLNVLPPNPIFLAPPVEISRTWTETKKKSDSVLTPSSIQVEILVEFPDGLERDLTASRLFVDGKLMDENNSAPFTTFTWDLTSITTSGTHSLQVTIEDIAGLKGRTIQIPVQVNVEELKLTLWERLTQNLTAGNIVAVVILLLVLVTALIVLIRRIQRRVKKRPSRQPVDPLLQPVPIEGDYTLAPVRKVESVKWPTIRGIGLTPARLLQKRSASPPEVSYLVEIPLGNEEIIIGSDPKKADYVLTHPSISPRHGRIFRDADGEFHIADAGSTTGTWVNYAPVSTRGVRLEHGDLVHFGRLAYLFEVHGARPKRIQVLPYKED
ncbi:MAG: FHA domain-containing protein [Anaerolineaceae bacterium]|nr:FHA domain-containing protein [Anaerolineaceae bacterium]